MERFTQYQNGKAVIYGDSVYSDCELPGAPEYFLGEAIDTLAAYEGTGLTPEEIRKKIRKLEFYEAHFDFRPAERWDELTNAEDEGRLVVLPCKVGDTVWGAEPFTDKKVRKGNIVEINIDAYGFCGFFVSFYPCSVAAAFIKDDIGKTVFLTREEAEKALEVQNGH